MNTATAPSPTSRIAGAVNPATRAAMPPIAARLPMVTRRRTDSAGSSRVSTSAATGAIRTARRAGTIAEITVTPTPTAIATTDRAGLEHQRR